LGSLLTNFLTSTRYSISKEQSENKIPISCEVIELT
jgi:hypothetical protein